MKYLRSVSIAVALVCTIVLAGFVEIRSYSPINQPQLRQMLVDMGYEVKDLVTDPGKEKYAVSFTKNDLNIPVGIEISPSGSYIWLTVNLGDKPEEYASMNQALLKENAKIQPTFFYITDSGRLMAALAIENRGEITAALLRQRLESISDNVGKSKDTWQK